MSTDIERLLAAAADDTDQPLTTDVDDLLVRARRSVRKTRIATVSTAVLTTGVIIAGVATWSANRNESTGPADGPRAHDGSEHRSHHQGRDRQGRPDASARQPTERHEPPQPVQAGRQGVRRLPARAWRQLLRQGSTTRRQLEGRREGRHRQPGTGDVPVTGPVHRQHLHVDERRAGAVLRAEQHEAGGHLGHDPDRDGREPGSGRCPRGSGRPRRRDRTAAGAPRRERFLLTRVRRLDQRAGPAGPRVRRSRPQGLRVRAPSRSRRHNGRPSRTTSRSRPPSRSRRTSYSRRIR